MKELNLYHSLFIFQKTNIAIERIMNRIRTVKGDVIRVKAGNDDIVDYYNQKVSIFLEEYNSFWFQKSEPDFRKRIDEVRNCCSPIMKKLKQWKDLQDFRNQFVAHNWRTKSGKFLIPDMKSYKIPRNTFDYHLMADFMRYMYVIIRHYVAKEFDDMERYMHSLEIPPPKVADYSTINQELMTMAHDVSERLNKYGAGYQIKVMLYEYQQ